MNRLIDFLKPQTPSNKWSIVPEDDWRNGSPEEQKRAVRSLYITAVILVAIILLLTA